MYPHLVFNHLIRPSQLAEGGPRKFRNGLIYYDFGTRFTALVSLDLVTCHKVWDRGGGRDLTGSPKLSGGKYWASKLLQMINMGHEAICFWICFQYLQLFQTPPALFLLFL